MNSRKNTQAGLIYGVAAVVIFLALILVFVLLMGGMSSDTSSTTDVTSAEQTTDGTTGESVQTTMTDASSDMTTAATTYPPATVPGAAAQTTTSAGTTQTPVNPPKMEAAELDAGIKEYLMGLDNTLRGWGPGVSVDVENRPHGALNAQNWYGKYGSKYIMDDDKIYLTFDEGYENGYTPQILDILKEKNVKAVFFITLSYAKNEPELVQRMIDEGHIVGNHSSAHLSFPGMTLEDAYADVLELHEYVEEHFGYTMTLFRFPMGESSDRTQALLQEMGYTPVFWSFAYADWDTANQPDPTEAFAKITGCAHPGALYLLHAVSKTNTELLPDLIDYFRAEGYEIALYPVN